MPEPVLNLGPGQQTGGIPANLPGQRNQPKVKSPPDWTPGQGGASATAKTTTPIPKHIPKPPPHSLPTEALGPQGRFLRRQLQASAGGDDLEGIRRTLEDKESGLQGLLQLGALGGNDEYEALVNKARREIEELRSILTREVSQGAKLLEIENEMSANAANLEVLGG